MAGSQGSRWRFLEDAPIDTTPYQSAGSPLKYAVLEFVESNPGADYLDLAEHLEMPPSYAADRLGNYADSSLLDRRRAGPNARSSYYLTTHGKGRLRWFRGEV